MSGVRFNLDYRTNTRGEKLVWGSSTKLKREEIRNWILENCVDQFGDIDLSYLDFSDFKGKIKIEGWLIGDNFYCKDNKINGNCFFEDNIVRGDLHNDYNTVGKNYIYGNDDIRGESVKRIEISFSSLDKNDEEFLQGGFLKDLVKLDESERIKICDIVWGKMKEKEVHIDAKIKEINDRFSK